MPRHWPLLLACAAIVIVGWIPATDARALAAMICIAVLALATWPALRSAARLATDSETAVRRMLDRMPACAWTCDHDGRLFHVNAQTLAYAGIPVEERPFVSWEKLLHPDDIEPANLAWKTALATGRPLCTECRLRAADGTFRWFRSVAQLWRNPENAGDVRWYGVLLNIDEQARALEELRRSEYELRDILERIPGMISRANAAGSHDYANRRLLDFVGQRVQDAANMGWLDVVHPEERSAIGAAWARSVQTGEAYDVEHRMRRSDGSYLWVHARAEPGFDHQGRLNGWYALIIDVEEQRKAKEALLKSEQELLTLVDALPALVWRATAAGDADYVNQRYVDYTGMTLVGRSRSQWWELVHPEDIEAGQRVWTWARGAETPFEVEHRIRRADGCYRWFQVRGQPLRDSTGRISHWYGIEVDIDDRRRMEDALRTTQAQLSRAAQIASLAEVSASIAHEINQPLAATVANGYACQRWLSLQPPNVERALLTVQRVIRDANAAADVVSRTRALFSNAALDRTVLDIDEVISEVCQLVGVELTGAQLRVERSKPATASLVRADHVQIQQVLVNLLRNAIDATAAVTGRPRTLAIHTGGDATADVLVEITDNGVGFDADTDIFEPFFTTKRSGMGMGLAICRSIVAAHEGRLWASRNPQHGSTFHFTLPRVQAPVAQDLA